MRECFEGGESRARSRFLKTGKAVVSRVHRTGEAPRRGAESGASCGADLADSRSRAGFQERGRLVFILFVALCFLFTSCSNFRLFSFRRSAYSESEADYALHKALDFAIDRASRLLVSELENMDYIPPEYAVVKSLAVSGGSEHPEQILRTAGNESHSQVASSVEAGQREAPTLRSSTASGKSAPEAQTPRDSSASEKSAPEARAQLALSDSAEPNTLPHSGRGIPGLSVLISYTTEYYAKFVRERISYFQDDLKPFAGTFSFSDPRALVESSSQSASDEFLSLYGGSIMSGYRDLFSASDREYFDAVVSQYNAYVITSGASDDTLLEKSDISLFVADMVCTRFFELLRQSEDYYRNTPDPYIDRTAGRVFGLI